MNRKQFIKKASTASLGLGIVPATTAAQTKEPLPFQDKVVLVTGAARGIGKATAMAFARLGAKTVLVDIANPHGVENIKTYQLASEADLNQTVAEIKKINPQVLGVKADVRDLAQLQRAAEQAIVQFGRIDVAVANAGIAVLGYFDQMQTGVFKDTMEVNLMGVANTAWAVLPQMKKQNGGRIISTASVAGRQGFGGLPGYGPSKWAVVGLTKCLAVELGMYNITVNAVAPTWVNTHLLRHEGVLKANGHKTIEEQNQALLNSRMHTLPIPAIEPENVADAIVFLASEQAKYITGTILDVAAGSNARYTA
jgi:NAD(P)-dependent dehydrogenase (short-subunit alcohol dehydrogenase family)